MLRVSRSTSRSAPARTWATRRHAGSAIRVKGADGKKYFAHTLNNTVVAPPRMLIAFLENNLQADGKIRIPEPLRMYMGGKEYIG